MDAFNFQDGNVYLDNRLVMRRVPGVWPTLWDKVEEILSSIGTDNSEDYERGFSDGLDMRDYNDTPSLPTKAPEQPSHIAE